MASGYPDWTIASLPGKTNIFTGQARWNSSTTVPVGADASAEGTLYTVPAGKRLLVGYTKVTCSKSGIQQVQLMVDGAVFCDMYLDIMYVGPLGEMCGWIFEAGEVITGKFYNNLAEAATFIGILTGILIDV